MHNQISYDPLALEVQCEMPLLSLFQSRDLKPVFLLLQVHVERSKVYF